jgi:serine/threonine protein kinase
VIEFDLKQPFAPSPAPAAPASASPASTSASTEPPTQLVLAQGEIVAERYTVGPVIGAGGMGIVYKAKHIGLGTPVALKVIRPDIARNGSVWRRFAREARALAALHNRHVVRVHDAGTLPSGLRYLVMELLEGTDLRRVLQRDGAISRGRAVDYAIQVCSALGDAHKLGIVHRDLKPENIFLAKYRACDPIVKLLDFGVALFINDAGQLTVPGRGIGSPDYLSPEQMQDPHGVDARSDIWGVGLLLFELLVGRSPLAGMNSAHKCLTIAKGPMPSVAAACPELPPELAAVIQQCLHIDPNLRPQSADALIAALEPFCSRHLGVSPSSSPKPPAVKLAEVTVAPPKRGLWPRGLWPRWFGWAVPRPAARSESTRVAH